MNPRSLLIVCRRPPYGNSLGREALDMALAAGAFEQKVGLYFTGDGVWQLKKGQQAEGIDQKNLQSLLEVLPLYDIESVYADSQSLSDRGLNADQLAIGCEIISRREFPTLCEQYDVVLTF